MAQLTPQAVTWPGEEGLRDQILSYISKYGNAQNNSQHLTDSEKQAMALVQQYINAPESEYMEAGGEQLLSTLRGDYNPETSAYYKPVIAGMERNKQNSIDKLRRGSQLGGNLSSRSRMIAEGDVSTGYDAQMSGLLLELQQEERNKQFSAIPYAFNYGQYQDESPLRKAEAARNVGNIPRDLETGAMGYGMNMLTGYRPTYAFPSYVSSKQNGAAMGAAGGAIAGMPLGPWGMGAGAVAGGLYGYFGSN